MIRHLQTESTKGDAPGVNCAEDPVASLSAMFVGMVQAGRIEAGQCPALRAVFLKPHGVVHGVFKINQDLPREYRVGLFAGDQYRAWMRFSSDTLPTRNDYKSTIGVGIKLFGVPGAKIFGQPDDTTFDFILQNMNVFFVNTAKDMCEFTRAGVIDHNYQPYLDAHPETKNILDEMAKPVGSVLGSPYWSCVPFSFGPGRYVKYKLEPTIDVPAPQNPPADPSYLAADLAARLKQGPVTFRFCVQFPPNPDHVNLDAAMEPWDTEPVHLADLVLAQQDIGVRGQASYGENLAWNIWRVTEQHRPQGSIAEARLAVYNASAMVRRNANGVPTGEPEQPKPIEAPPPGVDARIVRAAVHPAIGIARVGDSPTEFFIGPQVPDPAPRPPGFYRDATGALKREAAEFRLYGYNAAGAVVSELNPDNADIVWTVHVANRKAEWYQFQLALDIPDALGKEIPLRNKAVPTAQRDTLAIDPGPRSIAGKSSAGPEYSFDTGKFKDTVVPLGEIRTDAVGRLQFLGGHGRSASPSGAPVYDPDDPDSFNNANDWYDDIADGPVTATVSIDGREIPVEHGWVVVAPPNYGTEVIGWRTLYDLLVDSYVACGWMAMPQTTSFTNDVLPFLQRLTNLQWVNKGFAALFGKGGPMDFTNHAFLAQLAAAPAPAERGTKADTWAELRRAVLNAFRPYDSPSGEPRLWPWLYGDAFGSSTPDSPLNVLSLPAVQQVMLQRWADGDFIGDWNPDAIPPRAIEQVPLAEQPATLDKAALHFCLADAFHPGCEVTWPMRHTSLYEKPFRIRLRPAGVPEPYYGAKLTSEVALQPGGPLYDQMPGSISRWMALPWQGDTAFCRSGYSGYAISFDPYVPSFWPARVPNQVLTEEEYQIVIDLERPRAERLAAFNSRAAWTRGLVGTAPEVMMEMVDHFADMGIVEARPGVPHDPDIPAVIYVESLPARRIKHLAAHRALKAAAPSGPPRWHEIAGWESEEQMKEFTAIRVRFTR